MIILLLLSSCLFYKLDLGCKGRRGEVSQAINNGDTGKLRLLLNGKVINEKDANDISPLLEASLVGNLEAIKILIERGADANAVNKDGVTALMLAAKNDHIEVCSHLITAGCIIDLQDNQGYSALDRLIFFNSSKKIARFLLERYAEGLDNLMHRELISTILKEEQGDKNKLLDEEHDVNAVVVDGKTALMLAAFAGTNEMCELMLKKGWKIDAVDRNRATVLMYAAAGGNLEVCKLLLETNCDVNAANKNGATALMLAAKNGHKEVCDLLLDRDCNVNAANKDGVTALMIAADSGHEEVCKLLLDKGCDVNSKSSEENTALMLAATKGHKDICRLMLDKGVNPANSTTKAGTTVLMVAARQGYKEVCELLLGRDCNVNAANKNGTTALLLAAFAGHAELCELLLDRDCNVDAADKDGLTALMLAADSGHEEVCKLLLDKGCDVNSKSSGEDTALMYAASSGHKEVCELLLDRDCNVNAANKGEVTALMLAAQNGHKEVCKLLLHRGCNPNAVDENEATALISAALNGHMEICELLITKGSNINAAKKYGGTALMYALKMGHKKIYELLLSNGALIDKEALFYLQLRTDPTPKIVEKLLLQQMFDDAFGYDDYAVAAEFMLPGFLLENFISIKKMNRKGFSALHFAAINKESSTLEFLLGHDMVAVNQSVRDFKQNCLIDSSDNKEGLSPIRLALKYGRIENAKLLLAHGASPLYTRWFSNRLLLEDEPVLRDFLVNEALFSLLRLGRIGMAKRLITYSFGTIAYKDIIDLRAKDENGMNVYHHIAQYCNEDALDFLKRSIEMKSFDKGLLNEHDKDGFTPVDRAVAANNTNFVQYLSSSNLPEGRKSRV